MEQWLERYKWLLLLGVVVLVLVAVILIQVLRPSPQPMRLSTSIPLATQESTPTPYTLRVYVSGAVHRPDVYTLSQDSIVKDAIEAAGGPTEEADLERINLALPVTDGQQVHVPRQGEDDPPVQPPSGQPAASHFMRSWYKLKVQTRQLMKPETEFAGFYLFRERIGI